MHYYDKLTKRREALAAFLLAGAYDYQQLRGLWCGYFADYLYYTGWNKAAVRQVLEWGELGHNWKLLHWTEVEDTPEAYASAMEDMRSEVIYTSDRMSLDRAFRIHHMYNRIQSRAALKDWMDEAKS